MKHILFGILLYPLSCYPQSKIRVKPSGYYPPSVSANQFDTLEMFNQTFDNSLTGLFNSERNTTTDFTISGGKITFPIANGSQYQFTKQIVYNKGTLSENCYQKATVIINSDDFSYGIGIGWRSINSQGFVWSLYGFMSFPVMTHLSKCGVSTPAQGVFYGTDTQPYSVGDTVDYTFSRKGINYTMVGYNRNKGTTNTYTWVTYPITATPFVAHQIAVPALNWFGGGFSVLNWSYYIVKPRVPENMIIGNSITYGQSATDQAHRFADLIVNNSYNLISGGGADVTQSVIDRLDEIKLLHPKRVLLMIGGNDLYFGIAANTWKNNLKAIRDTLVNNGIEVIHLYPTARTIYDERPLRNFLDTCSNFSTDKKIDMFTLTLKSGTNYSLATEYDGGDGVHPSNTGHAAMASYANAQLIGWGYNIIEGTERKRIKIIIKKRSE